MNFRIAPNWATVPLKATDYRQAKALSVMTPSMVGSAVLPVEHGVPEQEVRGRGTFFIGQVFCVVEPGVIIDDRVNVVEADPDLPVLVGHGRYPAQGRPSAPVGNLSQLHDVSMAQLARVVVFVAAPGGPLGAEQDRR